MGRIRGFLLKPRVATLLRRVLQRHWCPSSYGRPDPRRGTLAEPFSRLINWTHRLRTKAKAILCNTLDPRRGYIHEPVLGRPAPIPKGYMAVYVGQRDGDSQRLLVPVVYFNHPLFGDLLKESEEEYGFDHPGGITIPCRISEFQRVQTRIRAVQCTRRKLRRWSRQIVGRRVIIYDR